MKARPHPSPAGKARSPNRRHCHACASLLGALVLLLPVTVGAMVYETETEFFSNGDFDGDGREDLVVVDRENGTWQAAYQLTAETLVWSESRTSGFRRVDGFSVGRVLATGRDALVFASSSTGRIHVLDASNPESTPTPVVVTLAGVGVGPVVALDIAGIDNTTRHDLLAITHWNDPPSPVRWETVRNRDGIFSAGTAGPVAGAVSQLNRVILRRGVCEFAVMMREGDTTDLVAWRMSLSQVRDRLEVNGLPVGSRYTAGFFGAGYAAQFLTYQPGGATVTVHPVLEFRPGEYRLEPAEIRDLGAPIDRVFVIEEHTPPRLLVVYQDRRTAGVFDYDGRTAPVEVAQVSVPANREIHGALTAGSEGFAILSGPGPRSDEFASFRRDGSQYQAVDSGQLGGGGAPPVPSANLFLFQFEPFVSPHPVLVQRLQAGTWTSAPAFTPGSPRRLSVTTESFTGSVQGLANPTGTTLGDLVAQAGYALPNQYRPDISIHSEAPATGPEVVELRLSPTPGRWKTAVQVQLDATPATAEVFYQPGSGQAWQRYQQPFWLARDATVHYYGVLPGGRVSPIHSAAYTFAFPPDDLDTDRDGVPDYVEIGVGLAPDGGSDSDGDGFSDLEELVGGTSPSKAKSLPAGARLELGTAFDLEAVLRPYDGTVPGPTTSLPGTDVEASNLQGSLLGGAESRVPETGGPPAALLTGLVVDRRQRLVVLATEPHFDVFTAGPDPRLGRELLKLLPVPAAGDGLAVAYQYGGGASALEAEGWVQAARQAAAARQRLGVTADLDVTGTLAALLFERQIETLLTQLGSAPVGGLSLFPHRPGDASRRPFAAADLPRIETRVPGGFPGYSLPAMLDTLETALKAAATAEVQALLEVATEIYRISSAFNNSSPGTYEPPVDELRAFLEDGTLDAAYRAKSPLTNARLAQATAGAAALLGALPARPVVQKDLWVTAATGAGACQVLVDQNDAPHNLTFADGRPYLLPPAFDLPVGSKVRVTGHPDGPPAPCAGQSVEVLTLSLVSLPPLSTVALNGEDDDPPTEPLSLTGDADGDGRSDLQEFFDHTDPRDASDAAATVADVGSPRIHVTASGTSGEMILWWRYPSAYVPHVSFEVRRSVGVSGPYETLTVEPQEFAPGDFALAVPAGDEGGFFQVIMRLK